MPEDQIKKLAKQLRNVGPKLAEKLVAAGIDSPEKLRKIGAKKAFGKMYSSGDKYGDFNAAYLYALEGAIRDCDWLKIPKKVKLEYKEYTQLLQRKNKKK
jgi:DNA transformation protein